ncbi:cache domain-containing sensor histidine kinase [Cohnella cholangitidis]|uniref:histidine kinase n=1 Tax=Cohnella cholangitidis TaxID=2598458 RepID=A0A7G5C1S3_9BACL|nr:sensor histidine kinase [Cohnella cholangitidis]QMV43157.1 HAMP domain-containing protein [Cohnella cholangitidis]
MHSYDNREGRSFFGGLLPKNLPIRYKLLVHFLLITILPSLVLGVLTDWVVNRIIERQMNENTLQLISKVNRSIEFYVGNVQNTTYLISFNPQVRGFLDEEKPDQANRDEALEFMRGFSTLQTEIAGIMVVNSHGEYLSNDMYSRSSAKDLTLEPWYQEAVAGKGIFQVIGHPYGRNVTTHANYKDNEVVSAVRAILDPDTQKVLGVVLIDLKLRVIVEAAQDIQLGKTGLLMVMDEKGESVYVPKQLGFQSIPLMWLKGQASGQFVETVNGRELQFIFRKSSFTNWSTIGVFSTEEAAPEVRQIRLYVGTFVFVVCLLGITASFALSHGISRPIHRLMAFMQRAESGDLTTRYWGDGRDEVGMLGRSYNSMLTKINELLQLTEKQEKQKREAELRILQAQIKPHFLYNTLDTIHWMARKQGAEDVSEMVEALSKLFRIGLSKGNEFIPLAEEFDHIRSYLQIQKLRYKDKLQYSLELDPDIAHIPVLKIILQPIVENAIYHGIKERRGPGNITVKGTLRKDRIRLSVSDDGVGIPEETLLRMRERMNDPRITQMETSGSGYGLANVQARLKLTYGTDDCGITIESERGIGTTVSLIYPIHAEEG